MPKSFTVHDLDLPVAKRLALYAERGNLSLNQAVKELLGVALGVTAGSKRNLDNGLSRFRGRLPARTADAMLAFVADADFSRVDEEDI